MSNNPTPALTPEQELVNKQEDLKNANDEIDGLKKQIGDNNEKIAQKNKEVNSLQAEIKILQAVIADLNKAKDDYTNWYDQKPAQLIKAKTLNDQVIDSAKAVIEDDIENWIDQRIEKSKDDLTTKDNEMKAAKTASDTAREASKTADAKAQQKQADYDALKQTSKGIDTQLQELTGLLDQANKAATQGDFVVSYFWGCEAMAVAKEIEIPSPQEYDQSLREAQERVETAKNDAADKKGKADAASKTYTEVKKAYDAAVASRRADLLKEIKDKLKPKAG